MCSDFKRTIAERALTFFFAFIERQRFAALGANNVHVFIFKYGFFLEC